MHGPTEFVRFLSVHPPVKPSRSLQKKWKHTLIIVRRVPTEPKTALAGAMVEVFTAFKALMDAFNAKAASSYPLSRRDLTSMVVIAREL